MFITLTHNTTGSKAEVLKNKIFAIYTSPNLKCTLVVADGGAVYPVNETKEEIVALLQDKETSDVTTTVQGPNFQL
jgi:hypothetical protein